MAFDDGSERDELRTQGAESVREGAVATGMAETSDVGGRRALLALRAMMMASYLPQPTASASQRVALHTPRSHASQEESFQVILSPRGVRRPSDDEQKAAAARMRPQVGSSSVISTVKHAPSPCLDHCVALAIALLAPSLDSPSLGFCSH